MSAGSGEEALEAAPRLLPDLVLLDIMMPGINGYDTCRRLRELSELKHAKIVMVSAKALTSERMMGYQAGADDYITKPFDPDELVAKVSVYLRLKSVEEVNQLKGRMLTFLNHETRTPLTMIVAPVEILESDPELTDRQRELVGMISSGAARLGRLVERVTFLGRLRSGEILPVFEDCNLPDIARRAIEDVQSAAPAAVAAFDVEFPESAVAPCDPGQIRWAMRALLENAVRVCPPGKPVEVRLHASAAVSCSPSRIRVQASKPTPSPPFSRNSQFPTWRITARDCA